jgi:hypothetical protein
MPYSGVSIVKPSTATPVNINDGKFKDMLDYVRMRNGSMIESGGMSVADDFKYD